MFCPKLDIYIILNNRDPCRRARHLRVVVEDYKKKPTKNSVFQRQQCRHTYKFTVAACTKAFKFKPGKIPDGEIDMKYRH